MSGEFPPGSHLQEEVLAEMLGVSRTPVRSALALLAQDGLLDYAPKRGFRVRHHGPKEIGDAWEVRAALEGTACRIVAWRGMPETELARLAGFMLPVDRIFAEENPGAEGLRAYREMNVMFHNAILQAANNKFLTEFVSQLCKLPVSTSSVEEFYELPTARGMEFLFDFDWLRRSHDDHHRIVSAISERDGRRAEYLMAEHVLAAGRYISALEGARAAAEGERSVSG
jgi:GntR family transcriptional regulator, vanillate catabolism transcriptional regulator